MIAEPWDVGIHGWRTGQFPPPFAEWNDRFRDSVRNFWLGDLAAAPRTASRATACGARHPAGRVAGPFGARDRGPLASVNFVTAHDGFTARRPRRLRRQAQRAPTARTTATAPTTTGPGTTASRARPTTPRRSSRRARRRSIRNLLGTLLLATGVPMLNAGDEFGRTQRGNNNAYCQDNETVLVRLGPRAVAAGPARDDAPPRAAAAGPPVLRQRAFFSGRQIADDGSTDLAWFGAAASR